MTRLMAKELTDMLMAPLTLVTGSKINSMARVWKLGLMELGMKEGTKMERRMAKGF